MFRYFFQAFALVLALSGTAAAQSGTTRAEFVVKYGPIPAGRVVFAGTVNGNGYAVNGELRSTGLLRTVASLRYTAQAQGAVSRGRFLPRSYAEEARISDRRSSINMQFSGGVPRVTRDGSNDDIKPYHVDPATQNDVLDPASAVFFLLRDLPQAEACRGSVFMFDGKRRTRLSVVNPRIERGALVCDGEYRRVAGFAPWEMEERTRFPFKVQYAKNSAGLMQVTEVRIQTVYGTIRLTRD